MNLGIKMKNIRIIKYNTSKFKFQEIIYSHFKKKIKILKKIYPTYITKFFSETMSYKVKKIRKPIFSLKKIILTLEKIKKINL